MDGFLTTKTAGADSSSYNYSSRGELLSVSLPDGRIIEYVHDPLGRRIAKKINGVIVEKYLWQGMTRLLAVYDGSDNLLMRFEYADGRMPVAMTKGGSIYYLTYDQVGSLRVVADASGNVVKRIDYDSFGNIINDTNSTFEVPFGFAGGLHDIDTGLVRFGYRDYDPDIERWTAKDLILFAGGNTDLYGYCLNDGINLIDLDGLSGFAIDAGGGYGTGWGKSDPGAHSASAGTGLYIGAKEGRYAEIGGFTYQSQGKTPGAKIGLGINLTRYYTDAEKFFKGNMKYTSITLGPVTLTKYADPCTGEKTGWSLSLFGRGFGLTGFEEGITRSWSGALQ